MLLRKMIRDLRQNAVQFLSIFVMTAIAILVVSGFDASDVGVARSAAEYLYSTNYKDIDIQGGIFTDTDISRIMQVDGVVSVNGMRRYTGKTGKNDEIPLVLSYIKGNDVSSFHVVEGEGYTEGKKGAWIEYIYAEKNNIKVGDTFSFKIGDKRYSEEILGLIYYPEFMYYIPNNTFTEPEYGKHAFLVMDINEVPESSITYDNLIVDLKETKGQGIYLTEKEKSKMVEARSVIQKKFDNPNILIKTKFENDDYNDYVGSMTSNDSLANVFLVIFMLSASLGIITTMTRITTNQRTQIGTLKALGFSRFKITIHYMLYSVTVTFLGSLTGFFIGVFMLGQYLNDLNDYYYQNPLIRLEPTSKSIIMIMIAVIISILVTYFSTRKILSENASEILRPEPPTSTGTLFFERFKLWQRLKFATRWNIRDVHINLLRVLGSVFGILICSMLIYTAVGFYECLAAQSEWQYGDIIQANYKMTFTMDAPYETVYDYGKKYAGQLTDERDATIYSDSEEAVRMCTVIDDGNMVLTQDEDLDYMSIPSEGALLTTKLGDTLDVGVGDIITFKIPGDKNTYTANIVGFCRQSENQGIIMSRTAARTIGLDFKPNVIYSRKTIPDNLKKLPEVESVDSIKSLKDSLDASNSMGYSISTIIISMAVIMGLVVLYNLGVLSYIEKTREIATLKVLGFQTLSIRFILLQQNLSITALGVILGIPAGVFTLDLLIDTYADETMDIIIKTSFLPVIIAVFGTFLVSVLVNAYITSKIKGIDMVEALKGVE